MSGSDVVDRGDETKLKRYLNDFRDAIEARERDRAAERDRERMAREREAAEAEERRRREREAEEEARRRRQLEDEEDARRRSEERRRLEEEDRLRRERERQQRLREEQEELERMKREAITGIRTILPVKILCVELKEGVLVPEFDSELDARMTRMYGPGLESARVRATATFTVETRNSKGQPIPSGGHNLKLRVEGPRPGLDPEIQSIEDNGDGTYTCTYVPIAEGEHTIRVTSRGRDVAQSPVRVLADPGDDDRGLPTDNLDDLRKLLEAIAREVARDRRNLDKLPPGGRKLEKVGLNNEKARDVAAEVGEEDFPRLDDFIETVRRQKDKAFDVLDDPIKSKAAIRAELLPMINSLVGNLDDWADDYKEVLDKINGVKGSTKGQRQRVHLWIHRKGIPVPQHIMVTTNRPNTTNYRRHIRVDASQGFYDTHADPAGYIDGLLGMAGEMKLSKIDSRDRYLTGGKEEESSLEYHADPEAFIVNDTGDRVFPSKEALLLEGALQDVKGRIVYAFLFEDALAVTQMVNNGERFVLKSVLRLDAEVSDVSSADRQFTVTGRRGKQRVFYAKHRDVAATWVSNIQACIRTMKGMF